jgi:hypothetical protein
MASSLPAIPTPNIILQTIQQNTRKTQKECQYTREERGVLVKYKEAYRKLTTTQQRADLFQMKILVDIFNYWDSRKEDLGEAAAHRRIRVRI